MTDLPLETADHRGAPAADASAPITALPSRSRRWAGRVSLGSALLMCALWLVGYAVDVLGSTYWSVVGVASAILALLAIAFGVVAIVRGQGRVLGIAGIVISLTLNPFAVLFVLSFVSGLFR